MNIYRFNLNLLKAFDVLMQTRSVSQAAARLYITQPAMSNLLRQLREAFNDEILVRSHKAMVPTVKAIELAPKIHSHLQSLEQFIAIPEVFDPKKCEREFFIGLSDYGQYVLLHRLLEKLEKIAPKVKLNIVNKTTIMERAVFEAQKIDLDIGIAVKPDRQIVIEPLFDDDICLLMRKSHPLLKQNKTPSLREIMQARFLAANIVDFEPSFLKDPQLKRISQQRNIAVVVPHIVSALNTIKNTELIAVLAKKIADDAAKKYQLVTIDLPLHFPKLEVKQVWHRRDQNDPAHRWLREVVKLVSQSLK